MISAILGTKLGQTQTFTQDGKRIPVTTVEAGPCWVTHISDFGGFRNIQLAYDSAKHTTKALAGHIKKSGLTIQPRFLREIKVSNINDLGDVSLGKEITVGAVFQPGDVVRVTGTSKGKGFAGVVKRHHFAGGPKTHGQSDRERAPGSIGQTTTPGRVYKGKRMAGRMGSDTVTVRNLQVVTIDPEKNMLTIKGVVPGGRRGLLLIQKE
ncbi:50S ribosomal protein L3 [Candidatus Gottesmanbacteria bacterium]|nr:50S ribosomal protein L3 [Candidatus Gottesmanbacteria bacterium]